jgi:2-Cys peroxiredoxin 5
LADPAGTFTNALELGFDSATIFGNQRSKRYALVVEDGKVKEAHIEPDNTGVDGSSLSFPTDWVYVVN